MEFYNLGSFSLYSKFEKNLVGKIEKIKLYGERIRRISPEEEKGLATVGFVISPFNTAAGIVGVISNSQPAFYVGLLNLAIPVISTCLYIHAKLR